MENNLHNEKVPSAKEGRVLVWYDEFDGLVLDKCKWGFYPFMKTPNVIYDNSEKHVRIEDGKLHLQVHRAGNTYSLPQSICTRYTMFFKYGYLEMRAKLPFRHGAWPSFWMMAPGSPFMDRRNEPDFWWPEVDIVEVFSSENTVIANLHKHGEVHAMLPGDEANVDRGYCFENSENLNDEYHVYGFSWDEHYMRWFVDGKCYFEWLIDETSTFVSEELPGTIGFHDYLGIIINNEVFTKDSPWYPEGSALTEEDEMPIDYYIDWVRLYQNPDKEFICYGADLTKAIAEKKDIV